MNLIAIQPLGRNREIRRLWVESQRLNRLGFTPGTPLEIRSQSGQLTLKPAILGELRPPTLDAHWGHEPGRVGLVRAAAQRDRHAL